MTPDETVGGGGVCDDCRGTCPAWSADNDLWNKAIGSESGLLCLNCFIARADDGSQVWRLTLWNA